MLRHGKLGKHRNNTKYILDFRAWRSIEDELRLGDGQKRVEADETKDPSPWLNLIPLLSLMSRVKNKLYLVPQQDSCETKHNLTLPQPYRPQPSLLPPNGFLILVSTSKHVQIPLCLEVYRAIVFRHSSAEFGGYSSTFTP